MDPDRLAVDVVIETACGVLTGRFGPREAVTLLASQAPHARSRAAVLVAGDPAWAASHAELLTAIRAELAAVLPASPQPVDLRAVLSELDRVVTALTPA